jgi:hypothetical protein
MGRMDEALTIDNRRRWFWLDHRTELEDANRQLQQAYTRQQLNTEKNMDRNYRAINRWDDYAIKGCQYWKDPNTGKIYTNNLSCRFGGR